MDPLSEPAEPATLRLLRRLVTILTGVMIVGTVIVVGLLVIRLNDKPPVMPAAITLPTGARASAFTHGASWYAVVTEDDRILIFDRLSGSLRQEIVILSE